MTSNTPNLTAVTDGTNIGTDTKDPVSELRSGEARGLISLACEAVHATSGLAHEIHTHIYKRDSTVSAAESQRMLLAALTCMETAEHYLRMLDEVLADVADPETGEPGEPPW